jgi:hypothetical protein
VGSLTPLTHHLSRLQGDTWIASFTALETLLGEPLPDKARRRKGWWSNAWPRVRPHERAWLDGGWRVEHVDLDAERVVFRRARGSEPIHAAVPPVMKEAVAAYDRRIRAKTIGLFALSGGSAAVAAGLAGGMVGFLLGRYLPRRS